MMNAESVKARLKNFAIKNGYTFQEALIYYGLERTIYRISISKYADRFVLKGGIFLYAMFDRNYVRATTDIDFLVRRISNSSDEVKMIFRNILSQNIDDALVFDLDSIAVENITEFKKYHGLHISAVGYLDRTRIPIAIDIGFGDIIYPHAVKMTFPVILDMEAPVVNSYSLESSIAEKLEAIFHNGYLNSRYKDFYDIFVLSREYSFLYDSLRNAIIETFSNRSTPMTLDVAAFTNEFINDPMHQNRWNAFLKKKRALIQLPLDEVIEHIKTFIRPIFECSQVTKWSPEEGRWK